MNIQKIEKFKNANSNNLMDFEELSKIYKKIFSLSPFHSNKKELQTLISSENFLFAFNFGIVILKNNILFVNTKHVFEIEFDQIFEIKLDLNKLKIFYKDEKIDLISMNDTVPNLFLKFQECFKEDEQKITNENQTISNICNNDMNILIRSFYKKHHETILDINKMTSEILLKSMNSGDVNDGISWLQKNESGLIFECLGICFYEDHAYHWWYDKYNDYKFNCMNVYYSFFDSYESHDDYKKETEILKLLKSYPLGYLPVVNNDMTDVLVSDLKKLFDEFLIFNIEKYTLLKLNDLENKLEQLRLNKLDIRKKSIFQILDENNDGVIDLEDSDIFNRMLNKNQIKIINIDKSFIQKFVKISLYLKTKKENIQKIYISLIESGDESKVEELLNILRNQRHTYNLLLFHSISMITSLVKNDLITFYEIFESFDKLGVFNSNWENEVSTKLKNIGVGINDLMYSIYDMENRLVESIENLTYITEDTFTNLNETIFSELEEVKSSISLNNLLTGIQTYQVYRISRDNK